MTSPLAHSRTHASAADYRGIDVMLRRRIEGDTPTQRAAYILSMMNAPMVGDALSARAMVSSRELPEAMRPLIEAGRVKATALPGRRVVYQWVGKSTQGTASKIDADFIEAREDKGSAGARPARTPKVKSGFQPDRRATPRNQVMAAFRWHANGLSSQEAVDLLAHLDASAVKMIIRRMIQDELLADGDGGRFRWAGSGSGEA